MSTRTKKPKVEFSEDQKFCIDVLTEWALGAHHLPEVKEWGNGVCIHDGRGGLSTFDFDRLTRLVILAHKYAVRIELNSAGFYIRIIAHRRKPGNKDSGLNMYERHPDLENLKAEIDKHLPAPV